MEDKKINNIVKNYFKTLEKPKFKKELFLIAIVIIEGFLFVKLFESTWKNVLMALFIILPLNYILIKIFYKSEKS